MTDTLTLATVFVLAVFIATVIAALILRRSPPPAAPDTAFTDALRQRADHEAARATGLEVQLREAGKEAALAAERARRIQELEQQLREAAGTLQAARAAAAQAEQRAAETAARALEKEKSLQEQIVRLEQAEQRLGKEFENLANRIFTQTQQQFGEQSKQNIDALLAPFREQIDGFRKKVEDAYSLEQRERHLLKHEIGLLKELNLRITTEAANLTRALKGDNKMQGNWGEMILQKILETSGLKEGHEYESQAGFRHEDGQRHITDVIVHLPEGKDVIIDSKVSLVDWERCVSAADDAQRNEALDAHTASLRAHIKGLSEKDYRNLKGVTSLDYVLMFVPIEAAFHAAIAHDGKLVEFALEKNIMLVSPTTLLIALRTIFNLWRYEYQNRNAIEIARVAGSMRDKLVAFVDDLNEVKSALDKADKAWGSAQKKLVDGKGNVIRQAETLVKLGVKAGKKMDKDWAGMALPDAGEPDDEDNADAGKAGD